MTHSNAVWIGDQQWQVDQQLNVENMTVTRRRQPGFDTRQQGNAAAR